MSGVGIASRKSRFQGTNCSQISQPVATHSGLARNACCEMKAGSSSTNLSLPEVFVRESVKLQPRAVFDTS